MLVEPLLGDGGMLAEPLAGFTLPFDLFSEFFVVPAQPAEKTIVKTKQNIVTVCNNFLILKPLEFSIFFKYGHTNRSPKEG